MGDQLHPSGRLETAVYERIGRVFGSIEKKEPRNHATRAAAKIGVFITGNRTSLSSSLTDLILLMDIGY